MRASFVFLILLLAVVVVAGQNPSQGKLSLVFEANQVFSEQQLHGIADKCVADPNGKDAPNSEILDYCLWKFKISLAGKGYLRANVKVTKNEKSDDIWRVVVRIDEGALYRLGAVEIKGSKIYSPIQIRDMLELKTGDIADGGKLGDWLHGRVKKAYDKFGYIQYAAELIPRYKLRSDSRTEGIVDLSVQIDEGNAFSIHSIVFEGNTNISADILVREMLVRKGDVFNKELFEESITRLNQMGQFQPIDADKDVDYRVNEEDPQIEITIHLKVRPSSHHGSILGPRARGRGPSKSGACAGTDAV